MEITNKNLIESNTVIVYQEALNPSAISIDELKNFAADIFGLETKTAFSEFPDTVLFLLPELQIHLVIEGNRILLTNTSLGWDDAKAENFIKFILKLNGFVNKNIKAFGLNYLFNFQLDSPTNDIFYNSLVKDSAKSDLADVSGMSVRFFVNKDAQTRYDFRFDPKYTDKLEPTNDMIVGANVHVNQVNLPSYSELKTMYKSEHDLVSSKAEQIIKAS